MYCVPSLGPTGCGPRGLAAGASPFPLRIKISPSAAPKATAVGYQPVGMKPWKRLSPGRVTSTTATSLLSALATSRVEPFGESARALGVEPAGARGESATLICSLVRPVARSTTATAFVLAQATKSRVASFDRAIAFGCSPTVSSRRAASVSRRERDHARGAPDRDVDGAAVGRRQDAVGLGRQLGACDDTAAGDVDGHDGFAVDERGIERPAVRRECQAAHEAGVHELVVHGLLRRRQPDLAQGLQPFALPRELADRVVRGSGAEEPPAVGVPGEAQPGMAELQVLDDLAPLQVHDTQARLRPAVVRDHQMPAVGVKGHGERQIADVEVLTGGRNAPAVRQQRHAGALRAGACRRTGVAGSERQRRCEGEEGERYRA